MLARDPPVVVLKERQRIGEMNELSPAFGLDPLPEESVVHDAERSPGVTSQVLGLDGCFPGTDQEPPVVIDRHHDGRQLWPPISPGGGEDRARVRGDEGGRAPDVHYRLGAEEPGAAPYLVLMYERAGVAVRQSVLVGKPVG